MIDMRRLAITILTAGLLIFGGAGVASADPAFGPGNGGGGVGNSGPQDGKCHPPGQTVTEPGCK